MHESTLHWLNQDFIILSGEASTGSDAGNQTWALFAAFESTLQRHGMSLADTVRSRLFGRDRATRDAGSIVRMEVLSGPARCATSSYIAPARFESAAQIAMDLIALRPGAGLDKIIRENDPPRTPCRYLTCGPLMVLSGQTAVLPTLEEQAVGDILPRITQYLAEVDSGWDQVAEAQCYLHESQNAEHMRALFLKVAPILPPRFACPVVAGYSAPGKLVEIEITATRGT
ncbi:MAG: enamine deaminase RidA (YjgF/YER057c/UK114 family) [Alphaproteobacteria bacterium]|jgi:enamine deaminase RidA (YjgF/YER057c/UK114 family)